MKHPVTVFAIATLMPVPLLLLAGISGGIWIWLSLFYMTVFAFAMDTLVSMTIGEPDAGREFPRSDQLSVALAIAHFALLGLGVVALAGNTGLGVAERIGAFFAFGLFFGQVSNSNAHELIHRSRRGLFRLGKWVFISLLFGHHTSAHRLVHHRQVGSESDPNSARSGQSFYAFVPQAWFGSFASGLAAENELRKENNTLSHPYAEYVVGGAAMLALAGLLAGPAGIAALIALAGYATLQLLMSDYVQHYGLTRWHDDKGRLEPVGPNHSWNAPHWFTARLMLNAPRHSDHHSNPSRPYPALQLDDGVPMLPRSLPVMGFLALFPGRWRRIMDPRVAAVQGEGADQNR